MKIKQDTTSHYKNFKTALFNNVSDLHVCLDQAYSYSQTDIYLPYVSQFVDWHQEIDIDRNSP